MPVLGATSHCVAHNNDAQEFIHLGEVPLEVDPDELLAQIGSTAESSVNGHFACTARTNGVSNPLNR